MHDESLMVGLLLQFGEARGMEFGIFPPIRQEEEEGDESKNNMLIMKKKRGRKKVELKKVLLTAVEKGFASVVAVLLLQRARGVNVDDTYFETGVSVPI